MKAPLADRLGDVLSPPAETLYERSFHTRLQATLVEHVCESPKISVIVPTYNCSRYIEPALASVFEQDYANVELLVVDDGSTDDTVSVLSQFRDRLVLYRQANSGSAAARNTGLRHATGEFVAFLDADDYFLPRKLTEQVALLTANASLGAAHSGWQIVNAEGCLLRTIEPWNDAPRLDLETWLVQRPVKLGAMLYRREWLERVGGFDPELRQSQDVDLMLRLSMAGCRMAWHRRPTLCYRQHDGSTIRRDASKQAKYATLVLEKFFANPSVPRKLRKKQHRVMYYSALWTAWYAFHVGDVARIVPQLKLAGSFSRAPNRSQLLDWLSHFAMWSVEAQQDVLQVQAALPDMCQAAEVPSGELADSYDELHWWLHVWWHYLRGEYREGERQLRRSPSIEPQQLVARITSFVLSSARPVNDESVSRLWDAVISSGWIEAGHRYHAAGLHLAALGRSACELDSNAVASLVSMCRLACHPRAWPSCWRTLQAALR